MRCSKARILLSASLDSELSPKEELALEKHISVCAACASEMESFAGLQSVMSAWVDEEPSDWLAQNFAFKLKDIAGASKPVVKRKSRWLPGMVTAGLLTVTAALAMIMHTQFMEPNITLPDNPPVVAVNPVHMPDTAATKPGTGISKPVITAKTFSAKPVYVRKHNNRKYIRHNNYAPRPIMMAANIDEPVRLDLSSRHAERMIMKNIAIARNAEGETTGKVTEHLSEASMAMNETIERVRGTLRVAADLMSAEQPVNNNTLTDSDGGNTL